MPGRDLTRTEEVMITVGQMLRKKGNQVWSIAPGARVFDALALMAEKEIGALVVVEQERIAGILSERDYAHKVALLGRSSLDTAVREIMTTGVVTVHTSQDIRECMTLMTRRHVRHLPVMEGESIFGILSIGDLVKAIISDQAKAIRILESYIHFTP